jgi:hypothetical protein
MKDFRDLKYLTMQDVRPISDKQTTGRRHSLRDSTDHQEKGSLNHGEEGQESDGSMIPHFFL